MMFDAMCRAAEALGGSFEHQMRMASLLVVDEEEYRADLRAYLDSDPRFDVFEGGFRLLWPYMAVDIGFASVFVSRVGRCKSDVNGPIDELRARRVMELEFESSERCGTSAIGALSGDVFMVAVTDRYPEGIATIMCEGLVFGDRQSPGKMPRMAILPHQTWIFGHRAGDRRVNVGAAVNRGVISISDADSAARTLRDGMIKAYVSIAKAAKPSNWVVSRDSGGAERDPGRSPKIPRSHQRRHYIVISDQERRRCFRESVEASPSEGRDVTPHARRAHYRHIGENDDGTKKYTWVRACWVGSTEAEIRGQKYRVELEL